MKGEGEFFSDFCARNKKEVCAVCMCVRDLDLHPHGEPCAVLLTSLFASYVQANDTMQVLFGKQLRMISGVR